MKRMPVPRSDFQRKQSAEVTRTDSLRSEKSDKRVSFNKDVGIKHIPRGLKDQQPKSKLPKDEWSNCASVHLEKQALSSQELEREAEDLVRLLDQVDCVSDSKPGNNLENNKNNIRSNNTVVLNSNSKKNNLVDSFGRSPKPNNRSINDVRTKNAFLKSPKKTINVNRDLSKINNNNRLGRRTSSAHQSTSDINDSDLDQPYEKYANLYKSVPDLQTNTVYYDNNNQNIEDYSRFKDFEGQETKNFMSVDNLYDNRGKKFVAPKSYKKNRNEYKSADNLTDVSIPGTRRLTEYKPYENLQSGFSSTTDIKMNDTDTYRPKVENLVKRLNSDNSDHQVRTHLIYIEREEDNNSRSYTKPNSQNSHNNNKPFSYSSAPLSSVEVVRRLSPTRDNFKTKDNIYNRDRRLTRSTSREYEPYSRESDYSAKIIITGNNSYDDDDTYETYQVGENGFSKHTKDYGISSNDIYNGYKHNSNNNMNMSSIGVQTDGLSKAPMRPRRNIKSMSPVRSETTNGYNHELSSASLVRRINHGFGRFDRSPSPPTRKTHSSRNISRTIIPLLSDTDESEFAYRRRMDPLAKIRNQVMIREKLQEENEAEEREELLFSRQQKNVHQLNSSDLQPLTVDEVDALTLEVDKRERSKLIVAHENSSSNQYRKSENNFNRVRSPTPKGRQSPDVNNKRTTSPGIFSTLERLKKGNSDKGKGTLKKKKKIKIKFFYDPRPLDKPNEDPLERFTEYKGSETASSKSRRKSHEDDTYDNYYKGSKHDFRSLPRESYLAREERKQRLEHHDIINRTSTPSRPPRNASRETTRDNSVGRSARNSSTERVVKQEIKTSRDYRNNKLNSENRYNYNSIDRKATSNNRDKTPDKKSLNYNIRNRNQIESEGMEHFNNIRNKFSSDNEESTYRKKNNYYDSDHHDSSDQGPSLSEKFRNIRSRDESPGNTKYESRISDQESNKKEKILRQRSKFFGVLMGEGRSKSPLGKRTTASTGTAKESTVGTTNTMNSDAKVESKLYTEENRSDKAKYKKSLKKMPSSSSKRKSKHPWPWSLLGLRDSASRRKDHGRGSSRPSSRPSSRASSRASSAKRPTVRSSKIRRYGLEPPRPYVVRDREADDRETHQWESATLSRPEVRVKKRAPSPPRHQRREVKYSADSSQSSIATPVGPRIGRTSSFQQKYFADSDTERKRRPILINSSTGTDNYRSLPNRRQTEYGSKQNVANKRGAGLRKMSPGARGSAGSSLQSSESEADSHQGSHASRASHISTGSNRSVYLHATAIADIPVRKNSDENSERELSRQSKRVSRSFSMNAPWKPRQNRDRYEIEYDNRELREMKPERKSALPPRSPRKSPDAYETKKVNRSQTIYKDSKLAGWLRRKRNKDVKGI